MELTKGQVAVVTGGGSGIGLALANRFAAAGLHLVLADVEEDALAAATSEIEAHGVDVLTVRTDVSKEAEVQALAAATLERFGAVHVVCNNAGVAGRADPWFGPLSSWEWVMGVNFWGVVHGCRTFLPHLVGGGHIVNTASIAGLYPGFAPAYDASKHAVVAISESLYNTVVAAGLPVGVSVLCPGWVRTQILESHRNWPAELGAEARRRPGERGHPPLRRDRPRRGPHAGLGRRRRRRRRHRRPVLGHPPPGLPRHLHRAVGVDRRARRPDARRERAGDAPALAAHGRGQRRPRSARAGLTRPDP